MKVEGGFYPRKEASGITSDVGFGSLKTEARL